MSRSRSSRESLTGVATISKGDAERMLCGILVGWHVKEVSPRREPEKRSVSEGVWDSSGVTAMWSQAGDADSLRYRRDRCCHSKHKILNTYRNSAEAHCLESVKTISSALSDCRGLLLFLRCKDFLYLTSPHLKNRNYVSDEYHTEGPTGKANTSL